MIEWWQNLNVELGYVELKALSKDEEQSHGFYR